MGANPFDVGSSGGTDGQHVFDKRGRGWKKHGISENALTLLEDGETASYEVTLTRRFLRFEVVGLRDLFD